jgi:hypothetical protein
MLILATIFAAMEEPMLVWTIAMAWKMAPLAGQMPCVPVDIVRATGADFSGDTVSLCLEKEQLVPRKPTAIVPEVQVVTVQVVMARTNVAAISAIVIGETLVAPPVNGTARFRVSAAR